jgi:hypothetical protein
MWPLVTALSYVADGVAWLLAKLRGIKGVFETLAFVGGVVAVGAVGLLVATIKQLAMWAPIAAAGVRALATQLMATTTGAAVSGAMSSAAAAGASTGLGAILMDFLVNPLKLVFMPVVKTLAALLTPLGLLVVAVGALAAYFLKKDIDTIREIRKVNEDNENARARDAETIRAGMSRRTSQARGASIQTAAGLSDEERLKTLYVEGAYGYQVNFVKMVEKRNKDIADMMNMGDAKSITPLQAAQFKNEMAQRDVVYLRNAIAAQQSRLVTESRPPTKEETDQLALLTSMVKYLEEQVRITQKDSDDQQKRRDEQEQLEQLTRTQSLEWGPMMY